MTETEEPGVIPSLQIYLGYGLLFVIGRLRDLLASLLCISVTKVKTKPGYQPLTQGYDGFYRRRLYQRIHTCWNRPISTCADSTIDVMKRDKDGVIQPGEKQTCINLGSYNYLGFGTAGGPAEDDVLKALHKYGVSMCSPLGHNGRSEIHSELERTVAEFLGTEDALIVGMGWATNSTAIPSLVGKGCLIMSDSLNHNSIAAGCRCSGAKVRVFKHNDVKDLEKKILHAIREGQPRTRIKWKKILIIIEGIYSMEGETCPLAEIVEVAKKTKSYLYVDEAHSIGALGKSGRGICDHCGVDPKEIDILMGTFTKSFGAIGGYVAGKKDLINYLRVHCGSQHFSAGLSPVCVQQTMSAFNIISGKDGTDMGKKKIKKLHDNSNWFREELKKLGLIVLGSTDSAIIPVIIGHPAKIAYTSYECLNEGLGVVVVGFPATPLLSARVRFCISAAHTKEQMDEALEKFGKVATNGRLRYISNSLTG